MILLPQLNFYCCMKRQNPESSWNDSTSAQQNISVQSKTVCDPIKKNGFDFSAVLLTHLIDSHRAHLFNPNNLFFHLPPLPHPSGDGHDCISIFKGMRSAIHRKGSLWKLFRLVTSKYDAPSCANYKIKQVKQHAWW